MLEFKIDIDESLCTNDVETFAKEACSCVQLYAKKNHDYGNSFEKGCDTIGDSYAIGRLYDKINRVVNLNKNGNSEVREESIEDTIKDLACYSIMYLAYIHKKKRKKDDDILL